MQRPKYPAGLETWWLREARQRMDVRDEDALIDALEVDVAKLSDGFTLDRAAGFGDYADSPRAINAYGLFFFPQTFVRTLFQFDEIAHRCGWKPAGSTVRIADLGAGTGSAGFAVASRLSSAGKIELIAAEQSAASLAIAEKIARDNAGLWPQLDFHPRRCDLSAFPGLAGEKFDVILASFSLNEFFHDQAPGTFDTWVDNVVARLAPGGLLLFSEPALQSASDRLERLRDRIAAEGKMTILAPCLHRHACPILAAGGGIFCHEVRWWKFPRSLQRLNRRLNRTIQFLKFSFLAVANRSAAESGVDAPGNPAELARLVSPVLDMKGRVQAEGCAADGMVHRYELLTRIFSREEKQALLATERGDVVRWKNPVLLGDKETRRAEGAARLFSFASD